MVTQSLIARLVAQVRLSGREAVYATVYGRMWKAGVECLLYCWCFPGISFDSHDSRLFMRESNLPSFVETCILEVTDKSVDQGCQRTDRENHDEQSRAILSTQSP